MQLQLCERVKGTFADTLDAELLEEATENALYVGTEMDIESIKVESGSSTGENFLGQIFRVKVQLRLKGDKLQCLSLIVKCLPDSKANDFLQDAKVFLKEQILYREVLPCFEMLSRDTEKFGARLYHARSTPLQTLVFEDLQTLGYRLASREKGLDEAHCLVTLRKLARFHAISMLFAKKEKSVLQFFHSGLVSPIILKDNGTPLPFYTAELAILEALVRNWHGYERIADKLAKYRENLRANLLSSAQPHPDDVRVLNHGDVWVNNILFKCDVRGQPSDALFVDFQMSIWGSLGLDLNYFFSTSVQLSVLQTRRTQLLRAYYDELSATLVAHNYDAVPSFEQVQRDVRRRERWGFFAAFGILPLISLDKDSASDNSVDNLANEEFARQQIMQMFAVPRVQEVLKYGLKRWDELGIFD